MSELDGLGGAVTGAMAGRAVEPYAGEQRGDGHFHEDNCLNCGTLLSGRYCAQCGQKAHLHRSLRSLASDFLQGLFNFEGKIWRTLPMLAWRPGEMTRRYVQGERARFVSPVAIYLFSVFLMFAVLNFNGVLSPDVDGTISATLAEAKADEQEKLAELQAQRQAAVKEGRETARIDRTIANRREDIADLERLQRGEAVEMSDAGDAPAWLRPIIEKAQRNPQAFILNIQDAASKFSWLLIPLSVPFLWLLFPFNRRYRLYDHTVFVTYSLSFMMMLVIAGGLLVAAGMPGVASFLFFIPPIHMYRQLRGAYQLSRFSAVLRTIALVTFAFVAQSLFFLAALAIGVMS